jgi:hypothetical protein
MRVKRGWVSVRLVVATNGSRVAVGDEMIRPLNSSRQIQIGTIVTPQSMDLNVM